MRFFYWGHPYIAFVTMLLCKLWPRKAYKPHPGIRQLPKTKVYRESKNVVYYSSN